MNPYSLYRHLIPPSSIRCFRDTDLDHARLQWRIQANLVFVTKICLERPSGRVGNDYYHAIITPIGRGAAQARRLGRAWAVVRGSWLSGQRQPSRARVSKNLGVN
eukprot:1898270-Pleurochrysis_carterae.AAC.1